MASPTIPIEATKSPRPLNFKSENNKENENYNLISDELQQLTSTPAGGKLKSNLHLRTGFNVDFPEGCFFGLGKHKDGAEISKLCLFLKIVSWYIY